MTVTATAARLPEFPWDTLGSAVERARAHPDGLVDLSIGAPVDPVPEVVRAALRAGDNFPGYPQTAGTPALREAAAGWLARRLGVTVAPAAVLPVVGTKEFIALAPLLLGCRPGDVVAYPALSYPTYDVGARLVGATAAAVQNPLSLGHGPGSGARRDGRSGSGAVRLAWLNSPSNPTGEVLSAPEMSAVVSLARTQGTILASDECYIELGWELAPVSILHPDVCGRSHQGLLAVHSLSKRSNMAGYRSGFVTGDPELVAQLLAVSKHAGLIVPAPVQSAMTAALNDDAHAEQQRARYAARRARLRPALEAAGWRVELSAAGLYLWASHPDLDCQDSVRRLAELGILVAPGDFYGPGGERHVRVALTATDERIDSAVSRLAGLG